MSKLDIRIQNAIENQLEIIKKMDDLRNDMKAAEMAYSSTVGKLSVLSELYEEQNGRTLQKDLDEDPSWKQRIDAIRERINSQSQEPGAQSLVSEASVSNPEPVEADRPTQNQVADVARRRQPATITVDDNPPGPGPDEG